MRSSVIRGTIIALTLTLGLACADRPREATWQGKMVTADGITIVSNPKAPLYGPGVLDLEEDLSIGEAVGANEYVFARAWYIAVNDDGEIFVMDQGDACVKVFSKNGTYLRSIGRKGQGPGELQNPNSLHLTKNGRLIFEDFIRGLNVFGPDGTFREFLPATAFVDILVTPGGRIVARVNTIEADRPGKQIRVFDSVLHQQAAFPFFPDEPRDPQVIKPFAGSFCWALTAEDDLAVSYEGAYEIDIFSLDGRLHRRIRKEFDPVKITQDEIDAIQKRLRGRKADIPAAHAPLQGLWADDEGHLYVKTYERTEGGRSLYYDVFDRDGRCLAKLLISLTIRPQVWKGGKMYSLEEDAEGFQRVKRYRLAWRVSH
jgi:hypothetical protein